MKFPRWLRGYVDLRLALSDHLRVRHGLRGQVLEVGGPCGPQGPLPLSGPFPAPHGGLRGGPVMHGPGMSSGRIHRFSAVRGTVSSCPAPGRWPGSVPQQPDGCTPPAGGGADRKGQGTGQRPPALFPCTTTHADPNGRQGGFMSQSRDAGQPSGLSAAFGGLRHRAGERLALPLYHRCLRRRGLRGRLPALPAGRPAGDDHGIRRGPCVPQQHGAGPESPCRPRAHAGTCSAKIPCGGSYLLSMFYTTVTGWMLAYCWHSFSGNLSGLDTAGRGVLFRQHPGQPLRTGAGHDHRGGRGLPGLRHGRAEGRGARGQGHHGGPADHFWCCWWSAA